MSELNKEPFSLGFEGESWNTALSSLVIRVPDVGVVMVTRRRGMYEVYEAEGWTEVDSALMAAALVRVKLDSYLGGNLVEQTQQDGLVG